MTPHEAPVPWLYYVFALIGFAFVGGIIALIVAALVPERAAAGHRPDPRGWWRRWTARNERVVQEREIRREHS